MGNQKLTKINMGSFDLIKGIAIISVVFSHIIYHYTVEELVLFTPLFVIEKLVTHGLMPMFFIISGYGMKKKDPLKVLKQTFSQLIIPYLCAAIVAVALYIVFNWRINSTHDTVVFVAEKLQQILIFGHIVGPLWYFIALFWAENILNFILKIKNEFWQVVAVTASIAMGYVLAHFGLFNHNVVLVQGLGAVGFCYLGYMLKKKNLIEKLVRSTWIYIVLVPIWLIQVFGVWKLNINFLSFEMAKGEYSVWAYLAAGCAGLLFVIFGILLNKIDWSGLDSIRSLGAQTYWVLIAHTVDYNSIPWYHLRLESKSVYLAFLIDAGLRVVFISMGCNLIKRIMQYRYMKKRMIKNV